MAEFEHRGLVEGYYGDAFHHNDRLWLIERLGAWGMNRYLYAPKQDPLHRERWREPYDGEARGRFGELVRCGEQCGVRVGFALSPGLSITYSSAEDVAALLGKLRSFEELGARFFGLALDDVPTRLVHERDRARFTSLAAAHVDLAHRVREALDPETILYLIPTDYAGVSAGEYLEALGADLAREIEVGWTGRTVVSPTITRQEAAIRSSALGRRLLVWDNVPVTDGPMRPMLHLGPYAGRDPGLVEHVSGVLLNPMQTPRASAIALHCAAEYLRDPGGYSPEQAWRAAVDEAGAGARQAFATFALAHRFSPSLPDDRDRELEDGFASLRSALASGGDTSAPRRRLVTAVEGRSDAARQIRADLSDARLVAEIEPWLDAHQLECQRMAIALDLLDALASDGDRMQKVLAFSRFEGRLTHVATPRVASFGPRRVLYPQLASLDDESAGFGSDSALFLNRCLADEFVALAEAQACDLLGAVATT